jgi:hypothetical protein
MCSFLTLDSDVHVETRPPAFQVVRQSCRFSNSCCDRQLKQSHHLVTSSYEALTSGWEVQAQGRTLSPRRTNTNISLKFAFVRSRDGTWNLRWELKGRSTRAGSEVRTADRRVWRIYRTATKRLCSHSHTDSNDQTPSTSTNYHINLTLSRTEDMSPRLCNAKTVGFLRSGNRNVMQPAGQVPSSQQPAAGP